MITVKDINIIKKRANKKLKWVLISLPIFFVILLASHFVFFEYTYRDKFYPGTIIAGNLVSGKSYQEVLNYFREKSDLIGKNGITFNIEAEKGTKQVQFTIFSKGLTTDKVVEHFSTDDWEKTLKDAYLVGREGSFWQKTSEQFSGFFKKRYYIFTPIIQDETVSSFFKDELENFLSKTSPAKFTIENGKISIEPEVIGEKVDSSKITGILKEKLSLMDNSPVELKANEDMPLSTKEKLSAFINFAETVKNDVKITLSYNGYVWNISGNTIVSWLTIKQNNKIGVDEKKLEDYFNKTVVFYIDSPMRNGHFEMRNGELIEISLGKAGNVVDIEKNTQSIENIITWMVENKQSMLQDSEDLTIVDDNTVNLRLKTIVNEPKITQETINKYNIKELVGSAKTNFQGGSLDRQHNIEVGVSKLNGILIAPGEEFSAVNAIGDITEEAGFVKEYVINNGKTQQEIGGGLCQLATTLFRLALDSGLPITERVNHRYVISYYGAGLDATIYGPHPDLRFINDTENYLLLQGKAVNNEVTFEFYGVKDGRTIKISEPVLYDKITPPEPNYIPTLELSAGQIKCSEIPHNGITADVIYMVQYHNGEVKEEKFHSVYQPWQKVCLVGIGK